MDFRFSPDACLSQSVDVLVLPVSRLKEGQTFEHEYLTPAIQVFIQASGFEGKAFESLMVPLQAPVVAKRLLLIGRPEGESADVHQSRLLGAQIAKELRKHKVSSCAMAMVDLTVVNQSMKEMLSAFAEGVLMGLYRFTSFKGNKAQEELAKQVSLQSFTWVAAQDALATMKPVVESAVILAEATLFARDLVNTPSGHMTPQNLAQAAQALADAYPAIRLRLYSEAEMRSMGMEASLAVGEGSVARPVMAHLRYEPAHAKKRVALVGKAVTFDSGGLSLKPADSMMTMKCDMAGAAAVLGVFKALASTSVSVAVDGIFIAVENMPSGSAYRPGDVVKAKNGMTIEVLNTDAEGRVTLADALSYAAELKPDTIIDLATLTGACVVALGDDVAAVLSTQTELAQSLVQAGKTTGEAVWELPLYKPYNDLIKSKIADVKNIGGRAAGTITAALFLQPFTNQIPWAHLDIAGPAFIEKESQAHLSYGGTGFGVRLLMRYLQGLE